MLKIEKTENTNARTVLVLSGDVHGDDIPQLKKLIRAARRTSQEVEVNCKDVRLLDREVVRFLASCRLDDIRLVHAPAYVSEWLRSERRTGK